VVFYFDTQKDKRTPKCCILMGMQLRSILPVLVGTTLL